MNSLSEISCFSGIYPFSKEQVLSKFTPLQKKLGMAVLAVFVCIGAIYSLWFCRKKIQSFYSRKDNGLAKEVIKLPVSFQPVVSRLKPKNDVPPDVALIELEEESEDEKEDQIKKFQILTENTTEPILEFNIKQPALLQPVVSPLKSKNDAPPYVALIELEKKFENEKKNQSEKFQILTENTTETVLKPLIQPLPKPASLVEELQEKIVIKPLNAEKLKINTLQDIIQLVQKHPHGCPLHMMGDIKGLTSSDIRFISDQIEIVDNYFRSNLSNHSNSFVAEEVMKGVFTFNRHDLYNFHYKIQGYNRPDGTGMSDKVTSYYEDSEKQKFQFSTRLDRFQYIIDSYILLHMQDVIIGICEARSSATFVYGHQKGVIPPNVWATPYSLVLTANGEYPIQSTTWEINDLGRCVSKHA